MKASAGSADFGIRENALHKEVSGKKQVGYFLLQEARKHRKPKLVQLGGLRK